VAQLSTLGGIHTTMNLFRRYFRSVGPKTEAERRIYRRRAPVGILLWLVSLFAAFLGIWWLTILCLVAFCAFVVVNAKLRQRDLAQLRREKGSL